MTDQLRIHESVNAQDPRQTNGTAEQRPPEFTEAVYQLHRALWSLATDGGDNPQATLAEMTRYARLFRQLLETHERVRRASTVRDAGRRLEDVIQGQRHAADVIGDINRRFDEHG